MSSTRSAPSIARWVALGGAALLVATLGVVGLGTGAALYVDQMRALDRILLAAAHGRAHPELTVEVEVKHSRAPVKTWLVGRRSRSVPTGALAEARRTNRPVFANDGANRLVLLPFEIEHGQRGQDRHEVAVAAAPRVDLAASVGPFALVYVLIAGLVGLVATAVLFLLVRRAFRPVERARAEADRVVGFDPDRRLPLDGPIEVRSLLASINALLDRLEAAHHAQTRFTAEAAHELRTPVAAMLGELDVTLRSPRSAEVYREALCSIRDDVDRLRRLVEGLTALARLDAGQVDRGHEAIRCVELANAALRAEAGSLREAGLTPRVVIDADPELVAHRALLEIALANLVRNAARHAHGHTVVLRIGQEGTWATFDVDDDGPGLPEAEREAVFDRFTRGSHARVADRDGLGLGLPVAWEIARRHGGDCVLADSPLGGLRARLTLPTLDTDPPPVNGFVDAEDI